MYSTARTAAYGIARGAAIGVASLLAASGAVVVSQPASAAVSPAAVASVIVRTGSAQDSLAAQAAVAQLGGTVTRRLGLVYGFAARIPDTAVSALRRTPGVIQVSADAAVHLKGGKDAKASDAKASDDKGKDAKASDDKGKDDKGKDDKSKDDKGKDDKGKDKKGKDSKTGSTSVTATTWIDEGGTNASLTSVRQATVGTNPSPNTEALTGAGVGVALIDSGVAPVPGLNQPGKVINGPDLSFESQTPGLQQIDTFGHGTHMAGIIAGSDAQPGPGGDRFEGIAPGAHLVSLKVASADGASDVSQVIAAIDWAVTHRNDPGLNIRVLNLSFGTDSTQAADLDPLSFVVEAAWRKGIVVVVSVGNEGTATTQVAMPSANPYVIAVGAADSNGTRSRGDDTVATFSSRGNATRHADLLAPGRSVVSLRVPGSYIDTEYPGARVGDEAGAERFFRGSGTSQAAAVISGTVALLLERRPNLNPDEVKALLMQTADPIAFATPIEAGAGQVDLAAAVTRPTPAKATQTARQATGLGTLEQARGTSHVTDETGVSLVGEQDIFGAPWDPARWTKAAGDGKAWSGGIWNGNIWAGDDFGGKSWAKRTWKGATWTGRSWNGRSWNGRSWNGRSWNGRSWNGRSWTDATGADA